MFCRIKKQIQLTENHIQVLKYIYFLSGGIAAKLNKILPLCV